MLQDLAAGLEEEETAIGGKGDTEDGQQQQEGGMRPANAVLWRQTYLSGNQQPPLTLGPVAVKSTSGK